MSPNRANLWIKNLSKNQKVILSDSFMYHCANRFTLEEGAKNQEINIKYWIFVSNEGCGSFKKGLSAISLNNENWNQVDFNSILLHVKFLLRNLQISNNRSPIPLSLQLSKNLPYAFL